MKRLAIREYKIRKSNNLKYWLSHLKYIFDQDNSKILFIIILLIYDTLSERIMKITFKENFENSRIKKKIFSNRWEKSINAFIINESHKYRYSNIRIVIMVKDFKTRIHYFLTAIPIVNSILINFFILI
jgi:hypothetical protein